MLTVGRDLGDSALGRTRTLVAVGQAAGRPDPCLRGFDGHWLEGPCASSGRGGEGSRARRRVRRRATRGPGREGRPGRALSAPGTRRQAGRALDAPALPKAGSGLGALLLPLCRVPLFGRRMACTFFCRCCAALWPSEGLRPFSQVVLCSSTAWTRGLGNWRSALPHGWGVCVRGLDLRVARERTHGLGGYGLDSLGEL